MNQEVNEKKYLFICDECGKGDWIHKPPPEDYLNLCYPCWEAFKQQGDNWRNWEVTD